MRPLDEAHNGCVDHLNTIHSNKPIMDTTYLHHSSPVYRPILPDSTPCMFSMKSIRTTLIAASLLTAFSSLSMAQSTAPTDSPRTAHMQKMHTQRAEQHAKHLGELKTKLNLSAGQESAWLSFEQSMQAPDHKLRPDRAALRHR